jgi:hypothetical protein
MYNLLADLVRSHVEWRKLLSIDFQDFPKKIAAGGSLSKYAAKDNRGHTSTSVTGAQGDQLSGAVEDEAPALHSIPPYRRAARGTMQLSGNRATQSAAKIDDSAGFSTLR